MTEREGSHGSPEEQSRASKLAHLVAEIRQGRILEDWLAQTPAERAQTRLAVTTLAVVLTSVSDGESVTTLRARLEDVPGHEQRRRLFAGSADDVDRRGPMGIDVAALDPQWQSPEEPEQIESPAETPLDSADVTDHHRMVDRLVTITQAHRDAMANAAQDES